MPAPDEWYLALSAWQICAIAFALMVSNGFVSTPPSELILGLAGYAAALGNTPLAAVFLSAVAGNLAGTTLLYFLASRWGEGAVRWTTRWNPLVGEGLLAATRSAFEKHGGSIVLVGRCLPMIRSIVSIPAGLARMPFGPFLGLTSLGCTLWALLWVGAGFLLGEQIQGVVREAKVYALGLTAIVVTLVVFWLKQQTQAYLQQEKHRENSEAEPPLRFQPKGDPGIWELGKEIYFRPLTNFVRVRQMSRESPEDRWRYMRRTFLASFAIQVFYIAVATLLLLLLTTGQVPDPRLALAGILWGGYAFVATAFFSVFWHFANNFRAVSGDFWRHTYVAANRALNRGMMFAQGGYFVAIGTSILKDSDANRLFQPALVAISSCALVLGVATRLTLSIVHFEPLLLAGRAERFYLDTLAKRRNFFRLVTVIGFALMAVALFFWKYGGLEIGAEEGLPSLRFFWLITAHLGLVVVLAGVLTGWGFVFPVSYLWHAWLIRRHGRGKIDAVTALSASPLAFDELFMVPVHGIRPLLVALAREKTEEEALPWLFFVLTSTYKFEAAARAIAELIDRDELRAASVLSYLRASNHPPDLPSRIGSHLTDPTNRSILRNLDGELSLVRVQELRLELKSLRSPTGPGTSPAIILQAFEALIRAKKLDQWPWDRALEDQGPDLLDLREHLRDLAKAKEQCLRVSRRAPYQERAQALHRAIDIVRQVRERLAADPWFGSLAGETLDRHLGSLYATMHRVLLSADLEAHLLPVPLQSNRSQDLLLTVINHGPGRAHLTRARLAAEGGIEAELDLSLALAPRQRQQLALSVHPRTLGSQRGELEVTYSDDLLEERSHLLPVELIVQSVVGDFQSFQNPFIAGPPLRSGDTFCGRTTALEAFRQPPFPSLFVMGPRRIGKTSLLYQMYLAAADRPRAMLDLQRYSAETDPVRLSRRLSEAIDPKGGRDVVDALAEFLSREPTPVLLIDECDYLPEIDARLEGRLGPELRGALNHSRYQLVLAGPMPASMSEGSNPLDQLSLMLQPVQLGLLSPEETAALLSEPLEGLVSLPPGTVSRYVALTGGHPYVAQLLARLLTAKVLERRHPLADDVLLEEAAEEAVRSADRLFQHSFWDPLSPPAKQWLLTLAHGRAEPPGTLAATLQDTCLVTGSGSSGWRISIGLFERWLWQNFDRSLEIP